MTGRRGAGPSRLARRLLAAILPASVAGRSTIGDVIEDYHRRPPGWRRRLWFWAAALDLAARYLPGRIASLIGSVRRDLGYATRLAWRHPALSLTAVGSLSLAIGVATAAFTLINGKWLRWHLAADPSVVSTWRRHATGASALWPAQEFGALREHATLQKIEGAWPMPLNVASATAQERGGAPVTVLFVTGSYLSTFEAGPAAGRLLNAVDDRRGASPVAVIDHLFWRRQFGGDSGIIGRSLSVGGTDVTVVGIVERDYIDPSGRQPVVWVPLAAFDRIAAASTSGAPPSQLYMFGRVRPELHGQAEAELRSLLPNVAAATTARPATGAETGVVAGADEVAASARGLVGVLSIVALVLVLAAANVSNLQLAGAAARQREIAVRCSCGATARRVLRQLATESVFLGLVAGTLGFLLAYWLSPLIATALGLTGADLDPDGRVYLFTVAATMTAAFGISIAPACFAARRDVSANLGGTTLRSGGAADPGRTRSIFIGIQAAASIVIVAIAALLVRALLHLAWLEPGYDVERLLTVSTALGYSPAERARARDFWPAALDRVRALPGVERASLSLMAPFGMTLGEPDQVQRLPTDADYFSTLGLRLIAGRTYSTAEVASGAPVAVISEKTARRFWVDGNPLGEPISRLGRNWPQHQVIGIVADAMAFRVHGEHTPLVYAPMSSPDTAQLTIRARDPHALAGPVRDALHALSPDARPRVTVVADRFAREFERPRRYAILGAGVAGFALLLSVVGLFGVTSFSVRTRTREIAIRTALGAPRREIVGLFVRDGLRAVVVGLAVGVVGALFAGRFLAAMLYGVSTRDPLTLAAAIAVLLLAALFAVYVPTRRALELDPAGVLRDA